MGNRFQEDHLTVIDPYNTECQIRAARITSTVLYPTPGMRALLGQLYRFDPENLRKALERPSLFYETLEDDQAQLLTIGELAPRLGQYHGEMVSVQGLALGAMVKTEDIPQLQNLPLHLTAKVIGVADSTGVMPIVGISSEDTSGVLLGNYRYYLSVYRFENGRAVAFLIDQEALPPTSVKEVAMAAFGDRVQASLRDYTVARPPSWQLSRDLALEGVAILTPARGYGPVIVTRDPQLAAGDFLTNVEVSGYSLGGWSLKGQQLILADNSKLTYERGAMSVLPTPTSHQATPPTAAPTPIPVATATPAPAPIAVPTATPTPVPPPAAGPTPASAPEPTPTVAPPTPIPAPTPMPVVSTQGRIAFTSLRDGGSEIYVMNPDGSAPFRLTSNTDNDFGPVWSPDGRRIAFGSTRDGREEIYLMDAADVDGDGNGDNLTRLTTAPNANIRPAWSPDGSRIALQPPPAGGWQMLNATGAPGTWLRRGEGSGG